MPTTLPNGIAQSSYFDRTGERSGSDLRSSFDEESQPERSFSGWSRLLSLVPSTKSQREPGGYSYAYHAAPTEDVLDSPSSDPPDVVPLELIRLRMLRCLRRTILRLPVLVLISFGMLHIILVLLGRKSVFWDLEDRQPSRDISGSVIYPPSNYPTDATRNVIPIPCHSHNDYWRKVPLFEALGWGCTSVEADVWLFDGHEELLVGHNTASLTHSRTFRSLYVNPLVDLLDKMNPNSEFDNTTGHGVFDADPEQTLVLLVDFKTNGRDLFPRVQEQLEPLRAKNYLSYWNGKTFVSRAITVVGTGNTPFDLIIQNDTYRDMFFDAPLAELWEAPSEEDSTDSHSNTHRCPSNDSNDRKSRTRLQRRSAIPVPAQGKTGTSLITSATAFDVSNSYYASVSFTSTIGFPISGRLSASQLELIRGQIRGARSRGLIARYWETPAWPTSLRNYVWKTLVEEGAAMLNVDDLEAAAKMDWTARQRHGWFDA